MRLMELQKKARDKGKNTRDCFLYMEPKPPVDQFAQCGTCRLYVSGVSRCSILGPDVEVPEGASCGSYVHGEPHEQPIRASTTPEEVGLVFHQVRCSNCVSFADRKCNLYIQLNKALPDLFDLDENVSAFACCNAQKPK